MKEYRVKRKPLRSSKFFVKSKEVFNSDAFHYWIIGLIMAVGICVPIVLFSVWGIT